MVNLAQSSKQTAQNIAKRIAQEQLEVLKSAREQVTPQPELPSPPQENPQQPATDTKEIEQRLKVESTRRLQELEAEMAKYRQQRQENYNQKLQQEQQVANIPQLETPKPQGKIRKAIGAMKQKISNMSSKAEKQRNVSG